MRTCVGEILAERVRAKWRESEGVGVGKGGCKEIDLFSVDKKSAIFRVYTHTHIDQIRTFNDYILFYIFNLSYVYVWLRVYLYHLLFISCLWFDHKSKRRANAHFTLVTVGKQIREEGEREREKEYRQIPTAEWNNLVLSREK